MPEPVSPHPDATRLIALVGAESSGKTTLARQLAAHFDGLWEPEYLREFSQKKGRTPLQQEQSHILQIQAEREDAALQQAKQQGRPYVFCDASTLMTAIYSDFVFNDASLYPQALQLHKRYALTLLLNNDLDWQADGLQRDGPQVREPVLASLRRQLLPWANTVVEVAGRGERRLHNAINALKYAFYLS